MLGEAKMSSLIDSGQRKWNNNKVRAIFNPKVVDEILKLIISPNPHTDRWLWTKERNCNFSVKSTYKLIRNTKR